MQSPAKLSVLVLEDDEALLHVFEQVLNKAGYEVGCVDCVERAFELLQARAFGILLFDLSAAGGSNAFQFIASVRTRQPDISVLIVTGFTPPALDSEARSLGIRVLEKPFTPAQLIKTIGSIASMDPAA